MSHTFSGREAIRSLRHAGFTVDHQRGSHVFLHNPGRNLSVIVPDHGDIKKGMLHAILRRTGLSAEELRRLA